MFNSLEKAKELLNCFESLNINSKSTEEYIINTFELMNICEDFIMAYHENGAMYGEIESLRNYIRLLEKENKELQEQK